MFDLTDRKIFSKEKSETSGFMDLNYLLRLRHDHDGVYSNKCSQCGAPLTIFDKNYSLLCHKCLASSKVLSLLKNKDIESSQVLSERISNELYNKYKRYSSYVSYLDTYNEIRMIGVDYGIEVNAINSNYDGSDEIYSAWTTNTDYTSIAIHHVFQGTDTITSIIDVPRQST